MLKLETVDQIRRILESAFDQSHAVDRVGEALEYAAGLGISTRHPAEFIAAGEAFLSDYDNDGADQ